MYRNLLKTIVGNLQTSRRKLLEATLTQKKQIKLLLVAGIISFLFILSVIGLQKDTIKDTQPLQCTEGINNVVSYQSKYQDYQPLQCIPLSNPVNKASTNGIGFDFLDPLGSIVDPIVQGISSIIAQGISLFDDYIAYTPNITHNDGEIYGRAGNPINIHLDKFYSLTEKIAWLFLPLIVIINGSSIILEGSVNGILLVKQIGKKFLLFVIAMASMRFGIGIAIDLTNALNALVLNNLIGGPSATLSSNLLSALGIASTGVGLTLPDASVFNIFAQVILWAGLFITLAMLLFQFIMRFFDLLLHVLIYPIILLIGLLQGGGQFFKAYIEQMLRSLIMQPIFLIALALAIEIIQSQTGVVTKFILGLVALGFLNIIPSIINRYSGILWSVGASRANHLMNTVVLNPARAINDRARNNNQFEKSGQKPWNDSANKTLNNFNVVNQANAGNRSTKTK